MEKYKLFLVVLILLVSELKCCRKQLIDIIKTVILFIDMIVVDFLLCFKTSFVINVNC